MTVNESLLTTNRENTTRYNTTQENLSASAGEKNMFDPDSGDYIFDMWVFGAGCWVLGGMLRNSLAQLDIRVVVVVEVY